MTAADFELEQYRALRGEILRAMEDGNEIMSFGLAAIGIVMTAGLGVKDSRLGFVVFIALIPALSSLVFSLWFAAHERIARASYFITGIEERLRISQGFGDLPMWDSWLRLPTKKATSQHHFWNTEYSGIAIFLFFMFGSSCLSLLMGGPTLARDLKIAILFIAWPIFAIFFLWIRQRVLRSRTWLSSRFGDLE